MIASRVPAGKVVADIGCDHGRLGELLLRERPELFLIAADISAASLGKAAALLGGAFPEERYSLRVGDGLDVLSPGEADTVIMAGLGGRTIRSLLEKNLPRARQTEHLLLSPHSCAGELREALCRLDFRTEREWVVEDRGRFYPLLLAAPGGAKPEQDPFWYEVGRAARDDPAMRRYVESLRRQTQRALGALGTADPERRALLRDRLRRLEEEFS